MNTHHDLNNTFYVIDFDRCLGDTKALYSLLVDIVGQIQPRVLKSLEDARREIEHSGGSFDVLGHLRQQLDDSSYDSLIANYLSYSTNNSDYYLNHGARQLIDWLDSRQLDYGIATYGGETWQRLKVARAGLDDVGCLVLDYPQKSRLITGWYSPDDGYYTVPATIASRGGKFNSVVLIDDKATAFSGLEQTPRTRGYWIQGDEPLLPSQQGSVPSNVQAVQCISDIVNYETDILT